MPPSATQAEEAGSVTEVLFARGTLINLFVGKPTFQKKLRPGDVLMDDDIDTDVIYLGHKKMLPKEAMAPLITIEGQARSFLAARTTEFPLSNGRFAFYGALPAILDRLDELKENWDRGVINLVDNYPALKAKQLNLLREQNSKFIEKELGKLGGEDRNRKAVELADWSVTQDDKNRLLYPLVDKLPDMFKFDWRMFKVSPLTGTEEMSTLDQQDLRDAQERLRNDLESWVRQASIEMHKTLGEAAANARSMLEKNGKLTPRNIKPLFDAFESFKAVDFTGASSFQQVVDQIKQRFGRVNANGELDIELTASGISGTSYGMEEFRGLLNGISELAVEDVAEKAGMKSLAQVGEFKRFIEID